ncbi:hypothetical protein [Moorena sp. SIO3H5]|uniref:hypothetical protein n=1 Tax=Moorena sp. SIO3H5 TaxID=2607834 RepID=UPI0013B97338|nr:hypothetical protein [Moorena sp. SIO3H5]NEO68680.1 hypothetical protein [Moorena sp. SIO3H5]
MSLTNWTKVKEGACHLCSNISTKFREWGMGNGEWGMGNGEWGMGNGEWGMGNG